MNRAIQLLGCILRIKTLVALSVRRMRRPHVPWMTRADDAILEFLLNEGNKEIVATPGVIEANLSYGSSTVTKRVRVLEEQGLLQYHDEKRGLYELTETGRAYLAGELDAEDLE